MQPTCALPLGADTARLDANFMGAPSDIAAAHRRQTAFSTGISAPDPQAAQGTGFHNCHQVANNIKAEDAHPVSALPDTVTDAHPLHMSMSGSLSSCSETFRADDLAEMDLQTSCMLSEEQYVTYNTMVKGRRHTDAPNALAANDDLPSFNFEQVLTCVSTPAIPRMSLLLLRATALTS